MRLISKTYLLVGILIVVAIANLGILYNAQTNAGDESFSIIRAGDLKVDVESISTLVRSISTGNEKDRKSLEEKINGIDTALATLKTGGVIHEVNIIPIPEKLSPEYEVVKANWEDYRMYAAEIHTGTVYNTKALDALNYVLSKNTEMTLTADSITRELEVLDRKYNRHKEIAQEMQESVKTIGQASLLISRGQEEEAKNDLNNARASLKISIRKLLQEPIDDLDLAGLQIKTETLEPIPRENSHSLNEFDLLWEAVELRLRILEAESIYSERFGAALDNIVERKGLLLSSIDNLLTAWNDDRLERRNEGQTGTIALIGADVIIFLIVLGIIKKSLVPLERLTKAVGRIKEGFYGEKIEHGSHDEIGKLISGFNTMSETILAKEREAKKIDIAKDEFLAMITHELKTPLVPIQGYADMLMSGHLGDLTDKQRERISIIKSSSETLLQLISDLLDVQKLELGQLKMRMEPEKIHETVEKSIQMLQPQINETGATVLNDVDKEFVAIYDEERITQVLTNLIKNSIKAFKPHGGTIKIRTDADQTHIKIQVIDDGVGIPPERQKKLFTKFYQADASLTREKGGSGLGLSICKGIVEAHGGKISIQSIPDTGTTVTFSLLKYQKASG